MLHRSRSDTGIDDGVIVARLAAAYACGIARNHGILDGNNRTAWVVARLFLADNGEVLRFDRMDAVRLMEGVAAGRIRETELAEWFRTHLTPKVHDRPSAGAFIGSSRG